MPWTASHQAPLSMGFPRQDYWSGFPFPSPGERSDPGIELRSVMSPALAGRFFTTSTTGEAPRYLYTMLIIGEIQCGVLCTLLTKFTIFL